MKKNKKLERGAQQACLRWVQDSCGSIPSSPVKFEDVLLEIYEFINRNHYPWFLPVVDHLRLCFPEFKWSYYDLTGFTPKKRKSWLEMKVIGQSDYVWGISGYAFITATCRLDRVYLKPMLVSELGVHGNFQNDQDKLGEIFLVDHEYRLAYREGTKGRNPNQRWNRF